MDNMSKRIYVYGFGGYKSKRWNLVVPDFIHQCLTCDYVGMEKNIDVIDQYGIISKNAMSFAL
jgi:hypothetical protein